MKTNIKKVFLIAAALVFLSAGVSFAHDRKPRFYNYNSHWYAQRHFQKAPGYRAPKYKTYHHGYKRPGPVTRYYFRKPYYPKKSIKRHNYYPHRKRYPSYDTFFFSFSVR